jgi:hypothetical protein
MNDERVSLEQRVASAPCTSTHHSQTGVRTTCRNAIREARKEAAPWERRLRPMWITGIAPRDVRGDCPFRHNRCTANHRGLLLVGFVYLRRARWKTMIATIH